MRTTLGRQPATLGIRLRNQWGPAVRNCLDVSHPISPRIRRKYYRCSARRSPGSCRMQPVAHGTFRFNATIPS